MDTNVMIGVVVSCVAVVLGALFWYFRSRNSRGMISSRNDRVFIYGPCGSGKTLLFFQFLHGRNQETQSSMTENVQVLTPKQSEIGRCYEFVDLSGHPSQAYRAQRYCSNVKFVIFMVDATDLKSVHTASKMLYQLLMLPEFDAMSPRPKFLIVANKMDQPQQARSSLVTIKATLLKELNKLYDSKSSLSSVSESGADEQAVEICQATKGSGQSNSSTLKKRTIAWDDLKYDIDFGTCSVLEKKIDCILHFLE